MQKTRFRFIRNFECSFHKQIFKKIYLEILTKNGGFSKYIV